MGLEGVNYSKRHHVFALFVAGGHPVVGKRLPHVKVCRIRAMACLKNCPLRFCDVVQELFHAEPFRKQARTRAGVIPFELLSTYVGRGAMRVLHGFARAWSGVAQTSKQLRAECRILH